MAFAKIRLNFGTMAKAYKDNKSLPADIQNFLTQQNKIEDDENESRRQKNLELQPGEKPWPMVGHSTSCCMQVSLSFNATSQPIPKAGTRSDRDNLTLNNKHYVLTVDELRAYLTQKYGPTQSISSYAEIKGDNMKKGLLIFGSGHTELWDGEYILQSAEGLARYGGKAAAVMGGAIQQSRPLWFWEIDDGAEAAAVVPDWVLGWWTVYDGNYYYYYFFPDGNVRYIDVRPNPKWKPSKNIGNGGIVTLIDNGLSILWKPTEGETIGTKEDYTRLGWTSTTEMNGVSNKYSPLYARKM